MKRAIVVFLALGALVTGACGGGKVIVGVVLPESGVAKAYGPSLKAGIKLAFDEAVAKNSPKGIEARYRDSMSNSEYAIKEADELFKGGAVLLLGGATSEEAKALIPAVEKAGRAIISPSATEPGLAASSNHFFRIYPADDVEGVVAASFLVTHKKVGKILIAFQKGLYADGMLPVFKSEVTKLGGSITGEFPIGPTDWDKAITEALTAQKPDAVFMCGYGEEILATLSLVRTNKYGGVICATSAISTGDVVRRAGELAEGVVVPTLTLDFGSMQEPMKSFVKSYRIANGGAMPDLYAALGYDAALVALYSLKDPQPKDNSELLQRIMSQGDKQGVTGKAELRLRGQHHPSSPHARDQGRQVRGLRPVAGTIGLPRTR